MGVRESARCKGQVRRKGKREGALKLRSIASVQERSFYVLLTGGYIRSGYLREKTQATPEPEWNAEPEQGLRL